MNRKKVLLICYYFPPMGGAGVGRPLALYKHLPDLGLDCHVLTVKSVAYRLYEQELLTGLPTEHIYRSGSHDPQRLLYVLGMRKVADSTIRKGRSISDRFFPDTKVGWVRKAVRLGRTLLTNNQYQVIISTSPPVSSHLVGLQLAKEFGVPWVADFRDYWSVYPIEDAYADDSRKKRGKKLLRDIQTGSAHLTAINNTIAEYVDAGTVIYNSFDSDLAEKWRLPENKQEYVIGILGSLNEIYPVKPLLRLLASLRNRSPRHFQVVRVLQAGSVDVNWLRPQLEQYSLTNIFEIKQQQKRDATIALLSQASLLYVGLPSAREKGFSTGRIYTMLSSGRPILAAAPPGGELEQLLTRAGNGFCFFEHSEDAAVEYLKDQIARFQKGKSLIRLKPDYAEEFSSERMAEQFATVLNRIIKV